MHVLFGDNGYNTCAGHQRSKLWGLLGDMYSKIRWFNFGENRSIIQAWKKILKIAKNPYYVTLRLAANISKTSSSHNFGDVK